MEMSDRVSERLAFANTYIKVGQKAEAFRATATLMNNPEARRFARAWLARAKAAFLVEDWDEIEQAWTRASDCEDLDHAISSEFSELRATACLRNDKSDASLDQPTDS